jgi:hypothetical protein
MKKVKLFVGQTYSTSEDEYATRIKGDIQDWTELSDDEYKNLITYKHNITSNLRAKGLIEWGEELIIIREASEDEVGAVKIDIKEIIDSTVKNEKAREEKEKKKLQKIQKTNEERKRTKELAQLKKLQEKYGEKSESA